MLEVKNISKKFINNLAVQDLSFSIKKPSVFGLLGTNGAGKSTTIRMILGLLKKDNGSIYWNNCDIQKSKVSIGYLPEERGIYPKIKVYDQLMYIAQLKGMTKKEASASIKKWANILNVSNYLEEPAEKLSKGNQQKIQFMTCIVHNPDLLILDEPFSGLDPINTNLLKNIIIDLVKEGKYIIMSAHQMSTIEEFCEDIVILDKGKTILQGNLKAIKETYPSNKVELNVNIDISSYLKALNIPILTEKNYNYTLKITDPSIYNKLLNNLLKDNIKITKFEIMYPTLNDIFIEKVGSNL